MMQQLRCALDDRPTFKALDEEELCQKEVKWCDGVQGEETSGKYDSFRACTPLERASWSMNQEYVASGGTNATQCTSLGGVTKSPIPHASLDSDCQTLLEQAGPAGTGTITFIPTASITGIPLHNIERGGMPEGVKGGIAAGVGIGLFILVALGVLCLCRRRHKKKGATAPVASPAMDGKWQKVELEHAPITPRQAAIEQLDSAQVHELEGDPGAGRVQEIDGAAIQAELDSIMVTPGGGAKTEEIEQDAVSPEISDAVHGRRQD
jgi:hypothetical protein